VVLVEESGELVVSKCIEGGAAEKMGILANDRIIEVNGRKVAKFAEIEAMLKEYRTGDKLELLIDRQGQRLKIEIMQEERK